MTKKFTPKIEMRPIDQVKPYDRNAKIHTESQVEDLAKVIKSQGWDVPIVVDKDGVIIKGHGRRLAALHLGLKEVPVVVRSDMTEAQVMAARLSDNRVAFGEFDTEMIQDELRAIQSMEDSLVQIDELGFSAKELDMMLGELDAMAPEVFEDGDVDAGPTPAGPKTEDAAAPSASTPDKPSDEGKAIHEVLGFKRLPTAYERAAVKFMAFAEAETGETGPEAFGRFCQSVVTGIEARA